MGENEEIEPVGVWSESKKYKHKKKNDTKNKTKKQKTQQKQKTWEKITEIRAVDMWSESEK